MFCFLSLNPIFLHWRKFCSHFLRAAQRPESGPRNAAIPELQDQLVGQWIFFSMSLLLSNICYWVYSSRISQEDMKVTSQTEGGKQQGKGVLLLLPGRGSEECSGNRAGAEVSPSLALGRIHNLQPLLLSLPVTLEKYLHTNKKGFGQTRSREAHL